MTVGLDCTLARVFRRASCFPLDYVRYSQIALEVLNRWSFPMWSLNASPLQMSGAALRTQCSPVWRYLLIGWFAVVTFGIDGSNELIRVSSNQLVNLPARWDASWYVAIAANGYTWTGDPADQQSVAFFPALPAMLALIPRGQVYRLWFGTCLAIGFFAIAIRYLVRLRAHAGEEQAHTAAALLAAYPFAVYFSAPYTESLFLAAALGTFYHLGRREHGLAAAWALLSGLLRPNGFLLAIPLALAIWEARHFTRPSWRDQWRDAIVVGAPIVGMLLFSLFLFVQFGDGFAWVHVQQAWGRDYSRAASDFVGTVAYLTDRGVTGFVADAPYVAMNGLAGVVALALVVPIARDFGIAYAAFVVVTICRRSSPVAPCRSAE